jgi:hypothetical protein
MSVPQSPAIRPAAGWRKTQGGGALPLPPQIVDYHQTHDVVYYQWFSKMGCALFRIRQVVGLEVGRHSEPRKAGPALTRSSFSAPRWTEAGVEGR